MNNLERLKKIRTTCELCNGTGIQERITSKGIRLDDCICIERVTKEITIAQANIPKSYRDWDLRKLQKDVIRDNPKSVKDIKHYIKYLESKIKQGEGLWLHSPTGVAKSSIICYILKTALDIGYTAYYTKASQIVTMKFDRSSDAGARNKLMHLLYNVDILAIENLNLEELRLGANDSYQRHVFFEFLSDMYDSNVPLLLSSNEKPDEITADFPMPIQDRLKNIKKIPFTGRSGR